MNDSIEENFISDKSPSREINHSNFDNRKRSKNILSMANQRKGSILKRGLKGNISPYLFQRNQNKNRTVAFINNEREYTKKRDTIENLKKSRFLADETRMKNELLENYEVGNLIYDEEYEYEPEKIEKLLHGRFSKNKKLTLVSTGAQKGDYNFYSIQEQVDSFSSVKELDGKDKKIDGSSENNEIKSNASNNFSNINQLLFDEDENSSQSSLGFHPNLLNPENRIKEKKQKNYLYFQDFLHTTIDPTQEEVNNNIEENEKLKREVTEIPELFRQHTKIIHKRKPDFLKIVEMDEIEKVVYDFEVKPDKYPFKSFRKYILLCFKYFFEILNY